jgi:hypothetical protein
MNERRTIGGRNEVLDGVETLNEEVDMMSILPSENITALPTPI